MTDHKQFENLHLNPSPPLIPLSNGGYLQLDLPPKTTLAELASNGLWPTSPVLRSPGAQIPLTNFGLSPPSSSPSPPVEKTPGQSHKRRAQNRASQRAYRDRKLRYLLDLEIGIRDIEQKIRLLQTENTDLIRQLCETRQANNDLRGSTAMSRSKDVAHSKADFDSKSPEGEIEYPKRLVSQSGEAPDSLFEPFAAMWNLIQLDPGVISGTVSAKTVLDRLREVVEVSEGAVYSKGSPQSLRSEGGGLGAGPKEVSMPVQEQAA